MKSRYYLLILISLIFSVAPPAFADVLPWEQKLPFESGFIRYTISGLEKGTEVIYVRDWGRERATYHDSNASMMGVNMRTREIEFRTPDFIYSYDLEGNKGFKAVNPQKYMAEEYNSLSNEEQALVRENAMKMGAAYAEGMGGKVVENAEVILGFSCDRVNIAGGSATYLIHGTDIPLKTEMSVMGDVLSIVASSVEKGPVDEIHFQHPEGIVAETDPTADALSKKMAIQALSMLKDPERAGKDVETIMGMPPQLQNSMTDEDKQVMKEMMEALQEKIRR